MKWYNISKLFLRLYGILMKGHFKFGTMFNEESRSVSLLLCCESEDDMAIYDLGLDEVSELLLLWS